MMYSNEDFYGDKHRWFIGRVINNHDPQMMGRVQIHIEGIHSENLADIPVAGLPWAQTLLPTTEGGTSGIGKIPQLYPGALVFGVFLDGETSQLPLIFGHLNQYEVPTRLQRTSSNFSVTDAGKGFASRGGGIGNVTHNNATVSGDTRTYANDENTNSKRWAAMNFFARDNGAYYTVSQAAGIVGNLEAESSLRPFAVNKNDAGAGLDSEGIAQWNRDRLDALKTFARKSNADWQDFTTQLLFVDHELRGRPLPSPGRDGASAESGAYAKLRQATTHYGGVTLSNATWIICKYYERPAAAENQIQKRDQLALLAYNQYQQSVKPTSSAV